jgi:hypothetical protein
MNNDNPTGEVRPMIDREPPNADKTQGAGVGKDGSARPRGLVRALGALPRAAKRRMVDLREPASGESRLQ